MCMRAWAQLFTHIHLDFCLNLHTTCNTARHTVSTECLAPHSHQPPYLCASLELYSLQQFRTNSAPQRRSLWIPSSSPRGLFQPCACVPRDRDLQQRWGSQEVERVHRECTHSATQKVSELDQQVQQTSTEPITGQAQLWASVSLTIKKEPPLPSGLL